MYYYFLSYTIRQQKHLSFCTSFSTGCVWPAYICLLWSESESNVYALYHASGRLWQYRAKNKPTWCRYSHKREVTDCISAVIILAEQRQSQMHLYGVISARPIACRYADPSNFAPLSVCIPLTDPPTNVGLCQRIFYSRFCVLSFIICELNRLINDPKAITSCI